MWMRRNGAVRSGPPLNGAQQQSAVEVFNPNHQRFRTCCCHCKTFTLGFSIVELFFICFMLVAIAPDFNTKICSHSGGRIHSQAGQPNGGGESSGLAKDQQNGIGEMMSTGQAAIQPMAGADVDQGAAGGRWRRKREANGNESEQQIEENSQQQRDEPQPSNLPDHSNLPEVLNILSQKMSSVTTSAAMDTSTAAVAQTQTENADGTDNGGFNSVRTLMAITCNLSALWLSWAIVQMFSILVMCWGVKRQKWLLFLPHIVLRVFCSLALWAIILALIWALVQHAPMNLANYLPLCVFLFLLFFWLWFLLRSEIRCCEFVKRSAETGFSVSNTRPLGPPTVSQSDTARGELQRRSAAAAMGIRKCPTGDGKRYQQNERQQPRGNGTNLNNNNNDGMTMSTLATSNGGHSRPSTAGTLESKDGLREDGGGGGTLETNFGGGGGPRTQMSREQRESQLAASKLPPLRHTHKMGDR